MLVVCFLAADGRIARADNAADDSYRQAEAQRQDLIARQLDLNYRMIWQSGFGPRWPNPFEPWPRVPGDIWGYPGPRPVEHPVGQRSEQIGPDHWIYRPVYADEVAMPAASTGISTPAAATRPAPVIVPPRPSDLDAPNVQAPKPSAVKKSTGPREF
jgi:hypothetical protein